ncbi:PREDICTED: receptor-like protein kinase HAIKU2 [Ipomoea nil]|uniref:receptor-like protein kinase HAIKU2 n=1 Tax=Ipomoea nil TaxID=35883 RepID=UPI00090155B9|nr:PREDICTED: receptor-like protein kinase HAIKU2 [Ipomoea nil]
MAAPHIFRPNLILIILPILSLLFISTVAAAAAPSSIKEIELSRRGLFGSVPFDSICSLKSLEKLSLGFNSLSGGVSDSLKKCVSLTYIDLGNNLFSGPVPGMSSLTQMTHLYLNNSGFTGKFPWNSLENMTKLEVLSLGDNPFDRTTLPDFIVKLTNLNWLYSPALTGD